MNFFGGTFYSSGFYGAVDQTAPGGPAGAGSKRRIHPRYIYEPAEPEPVVQTKRKKKRGVIETPLVEFLAPNFDFQKAVSYIEDDDDDVEVLLLSIH